MNLLSLSLLSMIFYLLSLQQPDSTGFQQLFESIANNKLYVAIFSAALGALLFPLLKASVVFIWKAIVNLITALNRNKKFQRDYLNWTINANKYISVLPSTMAAVKQETLHAIELDEIYINLSVSRGVDTGKASTLEEAIYNGDRLIILGDPGAGKSTMMQYLTLHTAYKLAAKKKAKDLATFPKRFPILIPLNRFHDIENWHAEKDLLVAIKGEIETNLTKKIPNSFLEKKLQAGECLILLDAFDELASAKARLLLAKKVKNLVSRYPDNQFIVTSRITGYNNQLAPAGFDNPFTIQKLTTNHIKSFIKKWYNNISRLQSIDKYPDETEFLQQQNRNRAENLIETILGNDRIRDLAINPMLLSLIALVHFIKVKLPKERHLLYEDCINILIEQWDATKDIRYPILDRLTVNQKKQIIRRIAYYMQNNKLRTISKNRLINDVLVVISAEIAGETLHGYDQLEKFLLALRERTGLLVEKGFNEQGQPEVSFSHLTLQEYLTAVEFLETWKDEKIVFEKICRHLEIDSEWWQEVALLALSKFNNPLEYQKKLYARIEKI